MKKIILLLFVSTLQIAFGQCADLTVKEHFAGDPIFRLESGDIVQICEDSKEISFGGTTLYILNQRGSGGSFIYEFKMDDVYYSPKYGQIQINTNTKMFGITLISGNEGAWTYFTAAEMAAKEAENQRIQIENQNRLDYQRLNADKSKYGDLDQALNANNPQIAKLIIEKLNFPKSYPRFDEFSEKLKKENEQQDVSTTQNINSYISNGNIEKAAQEYSKLNFQNRDLKTQIQSLLNDYYSKEKTQVSEANLKLTIEENKAAFSRLENGKYNLLIDKTGNVTVENSTTISVKTARISIKKIEGFEVNIGSYGTIEVSTVSKELTDKGILPVQVSTSKSLYKRLNSNMIYKSTFINWSRKDKLVLSKINESVPKNEYWVYSSFHDTKFVNLIEVSSKDEVRKTKTGKLSNRIPTTVFRTGSVAAILGWFGLRIIENQSIK